MKTVFNDRSTGQPLLYGELPEDFSPEASASIRQYPVNQILYIEARAVKGGCTIGYHSGDTYLYEKKKLADPFGFAPKQAAQNDSGFWIATPRTLEEDLDMAAASLLNKRVSARAYYDISETLKNKGRKEFDRQVNSFREELQMAMSIASMSVANIIRNYLFDGGLGIYEDDGKLVAVCLFRVGVEMDTMLGQGIYENITGEPFGQADSSRVDIANATWNIPYVTYMISDSKEDLKTFLTFADSADLSSEVIAYRDQLAMQVRQFQMQKAQMDNMQTQAQISNMFAMQQQQFASMDRMRDTMSRDLDQWRAGQAQMRQQMDARFAPSNTGFESNDDRIQRWRHESMMGVETYERDDGSTVEFTNRADRVFENNLTSTSHFGTEHYYDDYVPDGWHELKKK
ncbi:MAG: hypothetical protein IJJ00_04040 [Erysipelotrichaceae bacterium]|nr:hypothetical protein [Erysipelotrichaceae bacterium]